MTGHRQLLSVCFGLFVLCFVGCRAEKSQDIQAAQRVELLQLNETDPRPYFHAELKFANREQVKLHPRREELQKSIKVREAGSLAVREGKDFVPFKVSNRAMEGRLDMMMLFDLSGSMITSSSGSRTRLEMAKEAARVLLKNFRPGDRITIAPFESHNVRAQIENSEFAETDQAAEAQIARLQARRDGNTALYTATIFALERLQKLRKPDRQYMLVVLTDGKNDLRPGDDNEALQRKDDLSAVIKKLSEANIQTFTIGVGDGVDANALRQMVFPLENQKQYSNASDTQSVSSFLSGAKQSLTEQLGIEFFTRRNDYHQLRSLNFDVRIETLDGKILQGIIPWHCRAAAGCPPDRTMEPEEVQLVSERTDAPPPPGAYWKELLWLFVRFAIAIGILAGLWYGVPRLLWPGPTLPRVPIRGGRRLPPSRSVPKSGIPATEREGSTQTPVKPRQSFDKTRIYDPGSANRHRDES